MIPISKPAVGDLEKKAVLEVLESGMLVQGPRVAALEEKFAAAVGAKHAVATSSGTTALHLALLAHGIGPGDEVITTPFTFMASANSILYVGAKPVFVDVEEDTFNLNPELIEKAITPRTKAIMPVHLFGYACNLEAIEAVANRHGLAIIEDACQAIGAGYRGRPIGSFHTSCFSLYATKNIMAGEGGMVTTSDANIAHQIRLLRSHGMERRYHHEILGFNFRMTDLHAAVGIVQLGRLAEFTEKRQANAAALTAGLRGSAARVPEVKDGYQHCWHQYTVRVQNRDSAVEKLSKGGVGTGIFYPIPATQQESIQKAGLGRESVPVADKLAKEVLSLPVHPALTESDIQTIVREVGQL